MIKNDNKKNGKKKHYSHLHQNTQLTKRPKDRVKDD